MANINLHQVEQTEFQRSRSILFDSGMTVAIIFALIVIMSIGGVKFYLNSLDQRMMNLNDEENLGRQTLNEGDVNLAASFDQRLSEIKSGTDTFTTNDPARVFEEVQKTILSGVVASNLSFQGKSVEVALVAENFETLSKQILIFKGSNFFRTVDLVSTNRNEDGKVIASLTLGI